MTRFYRSIFLLLTLLFTSILTLKAQSSTNNKLYPTPGRISIMAVSPIPPEVEPTRQAYQDVIDCGFNLGIQQGSIDYYRKQFKAIGNLDFKYFISNPDLATEKRNAFISAFKNSRYVAGWLLKDEPAYSQIDNIAAAQKAMEAKLPNKLIYVNLVGMMVNTFTGPYTNYTDYLNFIEKKLSPQIWSFDFYPIYYRNGKFNVDYDIFYSDLEAIRDISKKTKRPFWSFCESLAYTAKTYTRPAPNEYYLRYEAFTALAYGAQGIVYWAYSMRKSNADEKYTSALVDLKGKKTKAWYDAQKVNREIIKFNDVFFQCNVKDIRHTGKSLYKGTRRLSGSFGPFKMVRSGDAGVVVSLIENKGNNYVVIVSRDVEKSQNLTLELNPNQDIVNITGPSPVDFSWREEIKFNLDKGGYLIFKVK